MMAERVIFWLILFTLGKYGVKKGRLNNKVYC
jgi:hypothetical protein